jgi:hypothetical protein
MNWIRRTLILLSFVPVMAVSPLLGLGRFIWCAFMNHDRAWRIAVGFDQLANVSTNGSEDETISSRAGRSMEKGERWACVLCRLLDVFEKDHCRKSIGG